MNENDQVELDESEEGALVDDKGKVEEVERGAKVTRPDELTIAEREEETAELGEAETDEERESILERRRAERKRRKQIGKEREVAKDRLVASLQLQVQELSGRLSQVDRRQSGSDVAKLEEELNQAISTANEAREHLKNSAEANDGTGVAEATELYYTARRRAEYLTGVRKSIQKQSVQQNQHIDPRLANNAAKWIAENKWYKHTGTDTDSVLTKAVDDQLASEGYDARTPEYWDELTDRLREKLPHRFTKARSVGKSGAPVSGGSKNSGDSVGSSEGGQGKFFLSKNRIDALKATGDWDDPARRDKMIKKYQEFDKQHSKKD